MKTLRLITCGSVDDGKSTLIGRMLYESKVIYADQERALQLESNITSEDGELDYALLLDGLQAEREQGITIDVAYRYFTTEKRQFIVADTPGHEEYTRNMAVGSSFADLAILLVDMSKGVSLQTKRHLHICQMMGIQYIVFALNKMDLVDYSQEVYQKVKKDIVDLMSQLNYKGTVQMIPLSAKKGENLLTPSAHMPWYQGQALLPYLETIVIEDGQLEHFTLPVQRVMRYAPKGKQSLIRGFQGEVASGQLKVGEEVRVLPGNMTAKTAHLFNTNKDVEDIRQGQAVTVSLDREIDVSRGDVLTNHPAIQVNDSFAVKLLWTDDVALEVGQHFFLKLGTKMISAVVTKIVHQIDIHTGEEFKASKLEKNDIGYCHISTFENIAFSRFSEFQDLGRFILINKLSNMTSACGTIDDVLTNVRHISKQELSANRETRSEQKGQKPLTIWFTGLSGSGKSTMANELEKYLMAFGRHTMLLDGDNVRFGLNKNLGFSTADRLENIRRVAEVSKLMNDAGLITITSTISPTRDDRDIARQIIGEGNFIEVYVSTPIEECERRDIKGLYGKARRGEIKNFTGINAPYETPVKPSVTIDTTGKTVEESLSELLLGLSGRI